MNYINSPLARVVVLIVFFLALVITGSSCATSQDAMTDRAAFEQEASPAPEYADRGATDDDSLSESQETHKISRASVNVKVEGLDDSIGLLEEKARDLGGFVSDSSINRRDKNAHASITLRVPSDRFNLMLNEIEEVGEVEHLSTSQEDVTRRYIDLEARINNLASQEKRLAEILQMADSVEDVLAVEKELERVRGEIESLTGDFNYLKNQVNMSTINVYLSETTLASTGIASIDFVDMLTGGYHSLINSINAIIMSARGLVIFIMGALPFIILLAIILVVLRKPYLNFKEKRQKEKDISSSPDK